MRENYYINFPTINVLEYFSKESVMGEYLDKGQIKEIEFTPKLEDIEYLRSFKFLDLTYRGTIEYRSSCTQPIKDVMSVGAFQLGLKHNLDKLEKLLNEDDVIYHQGYTATELRKLLIKREIPSFIDEDKLYELLYEVLEISKEGLITRDYGEEKFLESLYQRVEQRSNPARKMLTLLEEGYDIEEIIKDYGEL
jgi:gamma-glutamylcysteine synthetase